tara:strand:+ start:3029 stop:3418 length:390 start_codon:yes stop_codon:yes gene_type:complete
MEQIKKYFQFSGTISGSTYFLRNALATVLGFFAGYGMGYSFSVGEMGLLTVFLLLFTPILYFQLTTIYKRILSLFPDNPSLYTGVLVSLQIIMTAMHQDNPVRSILTLILLVFGGILIFKNSNIEHHEG